MNAVERLLAHGERALGLLGLCYRPGELFAEDDWTAAELVARRVCEQLEAAGGWQGWHSRVLLATAVQRSLDHKPASGRPAQALRAYRELLAGRRRLLNSKRLQALLADVVRTSPAWGDLARDVVQRAEAVADAVERLRALPGDPNPWGEADAPYVIAPQSRLRMRQLRAALRRLHAFEQPPQADKRAGRRKSGRPRVVDEKEQNKLADGWLTFARTYDGEGKPTKKMYIAKLCKGQRKGAAEQTALESRKLRDLQTALDNRRRKKRELQASRAK